LVFEWFEQSPVLIFEARANLNLVDAKVFLPDIPDSQIAPPEVFSNYSTKIHVVRDNDLWAEIRPMY
jgi:hypothetical protein